MFGFNRKSTAFQQDLEKLDLKVEALERRIDRQLTQNKTDLLEFAELSEKTRRLYLRLTRRAKIESEQTSVEIDPNGQKAQPELSAREIRNEIEAKMGV